MSTDTTGADPFERANPTREGLVRMTAVVALVWAVSYLVWRALFTLGGADAPASFVLLGAEILAVMVFGARVRASIVAPVTAVDVPDAPLPETTAVVDATDASIDELRTTLVSLRRVVGLERVVVVDSEGSLWLRTLAERFDATVCEPSVTVTEAARGAGTNWVPLLRGGDLPMPDLVSMRAARCSAPGVAVVQVGVEEADPTSFEHDPDGRWSLEPFEQQVLRPSLAARGSIPWYGDGPVLIRRTALSHIEGIASPADMRRAGVAIVRAGMTVTHLPLTLALVRGPEGIGESLQRRHTHLRRDGRYSADCGDCPGRPGPLTSWPSPRSSARCSVCCGSPPPSWCWGSPRCRWRRQRSTSP